MNKTQIQNLIDLKYQKTRLPFVTLKYAQTLDGKIATQKKDSQWISSPSSLRYSHRWRSQNQAVLVGVGTVLADDPRLTVRLVIGKNPIRVIVDSRLRIPLTSNILKTKEDSKIIIATTSSASRKRILEFEKRGIDVWIIKKNRNNQVDLKDLLSKLGEKNIKSLLVEGGAKIITSFLEQKLADRMIILIAPKIIGKGIFSVTQLGEKGKENPVFFSSFKIYQKGEDLIFDGFINKKGNTKGSI